MTSEAPVWLFDGVCVLCSRSVAFLLLHERDHLVRFVSIQSIEGQLLARRHGLDPSDPESFLFIDHNVALAASDGLYALAAHLKAPMRWLRLLVVVPKPLRDWVYYRIARNRYRLFGKMETCLVPPPAQRDRFVMP